MIPSPEDLKNNFSKEEVNRVVKIISSLLERNGYLERTQEFCSKYNIKWKYEMFQEVVKLFKEAGWKHSRISYDWINITNDPPPSAESYYNK